MTGVSVAPPRLRSTAEQQSLAATNESNEFEQVRLHPPMNPCDTCDACYSPPFTLLLVILIILIIVITWRGGSRKEPPPYSPLPPLSSLTHCVGGGRCSPT